MKRTAKIGSLICGAGTITVYRKYDDNLNPFLVYLESRYNDEEHDYPTKHRKFIAKYANLSSCTAVIHSIVMNHDIGGLSHEDQAYYKWN